MRWIIISETVSCRYHPKREGKTKCENCGAPICLECMEKVKVRRGGSVGGETHVNVYGIAEMCIPCACDKQKMNPKLFMIIAIIFSTILGIISLTLGPFLADFPIPQGASAARVIFFIIFPIIIIICLALALLNIPKSKKKNAILEQKKQEFLATHKISP